jgi:adhesin transport system outer membrane protein
MSRGAVAVALAVCLAAACGRADAMSLSEAVDQAVRTNPRIDAAEASRRASSYVLRQAKGRLLPEVELNADIGQQKIDRPNGLGPTVNNQWNDRRQVTVSVRQVLFDGWDRANDIYRSRALISAASFKLLARSETVGLASVEAYIDVVRHNELLGLAYANVERHKKLLAIIRERFEGGKSPVGDVEQTVERLEAAKALAAQIKIARETANAKFKSVVGAPPAKLQKVAYAAGIPKTSAEVVNVSLSNNPQVKAALADIDVSHFDKKQFSATLLPQLWLEGNATRGENLEGTPGRNDELEGKLVLNWKLLDGGVRRNRVAELGERENEKIAEQMVLVRELTEESETAWARLTDGRDQVAALQKQAAQNGKVVATYRDEYNANRRSLLDVLDAENARFGSEFDLSNARAINLYASYELLAYMGVLLETLNVTAPQMDMVPTATLPGVLARSPSRGYTILPLTRE